MIHAINPATEQRIASYDLHTPAQVGQKLANAAKAQKNWALKPVEERASLLLSLAAVLRRNSAAYALLITREMGKPITEAEAEIE
uniref:aldehyde dehydrogenase family protein n=1 Tax=Paracandidimonas soli TaxID=1917182 RepID=UPI00333F0BAF